MRIILIVYGIMERGVVQTRVPHSADVASSPGDVRVLKALKILFVLVATSRNTRCKFLGMMTPAKLLMANAIMN